MNKQGWFVDVMRNVMEYVPMETKFVIRRTCVLFNELVMLDCRMVKFYAEWRKAPYIEEVLSFFLDYNYLIAEAILRVPNALKNRCCYLSGKGVLKQVEKRRWELVRLMCPYLVEEFAFNSIFYAALAASQFQLVELCVEHMNIESVFKIFCIQNQVGMMEYMWYQFEDMLPISHMLENAIDQNSLDITRLVMRKNGLTLDRVRKRIESTQRRIEVLNQWETLLA